MSITLMVGELKVVNFKEGPEECRCFIEGAPEVNMANSNFYGLAKKFGLPMDDDYYYSGGLSEEQTFEMYKKLVKMQEIYTFPIENEYEYNRLQQWIGVFDYAVKNNHFVYWA